MHSELNIPSIVAKYYLLLAYDVYNGLESTNDDKMSEDEISTHIYKCIKLKCSFPSGNKANGRVKLFGNNIRLLISDWKHLNKLIECCDCKFNPFKIKFSILLNCNASTFRKNPVESVQVNLQQQLQL